MSHTILDTDQSRPAMFVDLGPLLADCLRKSSQRPSRCASCMLKDSVKLTPLPSHCSGELLGGCDIIMELQQAGELKENIDEMCART